MKTHDFDIVSFLSGLVVTGIGLVFLIPQDTSDVWSFLGDIGGWFWPVVLLAIGVAIIVPAVTSSRKETDAVEYQSTGTG